MQQKSSLLFHDRLERLRVERQWTWKQLADALALSVGFLIMVNRGKRTLSKKAEWRLRQAEAESGIVAPPAFDQDKAGIVLEAHDHEPTREYLSTTPAHEALDKLSQRNRSLCKLLVDHIVAAERMDAQKRKKKR